MSNIFVLIQTLAVQENQAVSGKNKVVKLIEDLAEKVNLSLQDAFFQKTEIKDIYLISLTVGWEPAAKFNRLSLSMSKAEINEHLNHIIKKSPTSSLSVESEVALTCAFMLPEKCSIESAWTEGFVFLSDYENLSSINVFGPRNSKNREIVHQSYSGGEFDTGFMEGGPGLYRYEPENWELFFDSSDLLASSYKYVQG